MMVRGPSSPSRGRPASAAALSGRCPLPYEERLGIAAWRLERSFAAVAGVAVVAAVAAAAVDVAVAVAFAVAVAVAVAGCRRRTEPAVREELV